VASPQVQRQILSQAASLLAGARDFDDTLRQAIACCLPVLGDFGFFDVAIGASVKRTACAHQAPDIEALLAPTRWVRQDHPELNLCGLSTGTPALHAETGETFYRSIAADDAHLDLLQRLAFTSMLTVPMRYRGELVGALTLFMGRSGRRHTQQDLDFACELSDLAAPLVSNARLLEQHRQTEAALRASEEQLRLAVEAGQLGIWDWDIKHNRVSWSPRVYEMHEMELGSDTGGLDGFRSRIHPDDRERVLNSIGKALAGGQIYSEEFRANLPSGRNCWISTRAHLVRDAQGRPLRMVGASADITERAQLLVAERQARGEAEAARLRMELLAGAGTGLSQSLDPQDTLAAIATTIVPRIADWCRIDLLDDAGALHCRIAHHTDPAQAARAMALARVAPSEPGSVGSVAWVIAHGQPYHGVVGAPQDQAGAGARLVVGSLGLREVFCLPLIARGRTIGAMSVAQAESGRQLGEDDRVMVLQLAQRAALALDNARLYAEAEAARRQAEAANRAKDEFLAMLGHELRNPLAPIAAALELMGRRDPQASADERRIIGRQVAHLSRLIDDLLDISRITQGKVQLLREAVDMKAVVANALELTRPLFDKHAQPVQLRLPDVPAMVRGDAVRLTQVLCNLLVNAAKFTPPEGRVSLELVVQDAQVLASVQDAGSGIAPDLLPQVFDLFVQGGQTIARQGGGLGLGLAIVRSLVELHGGSVSAASEGLGKGSRFLVSLPAGTEPADGGVQPQLQSPQAPRPQSAGGRILVVDDNSDAAETLADLLRLSDYEVRTAGHANEALVLVESFAPALALLDIGLPDIDGYQLAGMVKDLPGAAGIKLVALTGYGRDNDRAQALEARFDEHLVKPVDIDKLLDTLARLLGP
jgi:PAS domain S-box-containing protein